MDVSKTTSLFQAVQPSEKIIYLVTSDYDFATHISQQIIHFGYLVQHLRSIRQIPHPNTDQNLASIIIDVPSSDEVDRSTLFADLNEMPHTYGSLIFISERDDQQVRLKAIQAGGMAFFTKPANIVSLIDTLDALNQKSITPQPPRVIIIDHQHAVASYYQMILKMSGINAIIVGDPSQVLDQIHEFHPDLIMMNGFLPDIDAANLARLIRQIDEFVSIPIIFLSNEDDFAKRKEALDLGADDFLVKPVKAAHLMAVVRSRLERSRTLRSFMVRDSLTGLLNHTAFRSVLSQEVNRCKRQNARISLAMLDIDHFKQVNDTYGHAAGDSAIKVLSRLLKQRLRSSDIVGRYGGDEFVALLLDCESEQAFKIMDEIREHFSQIEFYPNEARSLFLTFSCGISTYPNFTSAESMSDAADQALYQAKAGKRNQVKVALL